MTCLSLCTGPLAGPWVVTGWGAGQKQEHRWEAVVCRNNGEGHEEGQKAGAGEGLEVSWPGLHLYESSVVCLPPQTDSSSEGRNPSCLRTQPLCIPKAELLPASQLH